MEAFTSFFANKKNIAIAAAAAVALGVGLFALFSGGEPPVDERREDPEKYIRLAFENMTRSLELPDPDVGWMFDILDGRHEIDLGLSFRDINIPLPVDRQIMLLAQLARLDANITRDTAAREMQADLNLSTGGVPMLSADMYMSDDEFALRLPQGFDYFVTLDPRHATGALTDSLLGEYVAQWIMTGDLMDAFIYEIYSRLFTAVKNPGMLMLANDTGTLFEGAEFGFMDETDGVYVYSLVINGDSFNSWFRSFVRSLENFELFRQLGVDLSGLHYFTVTGDVEMLLDVRDDFILGGTADVPLYGGAAASVRFILYGERNPADAVEITLEMKNPNSTFNESAGRAQPNFCIASAINPYVMIYEMPPRVIIEIRHKNDSENPEIIDHHLSVVMSNPETLAADRTMIDWKLFWDRTGDTLDNFRLNANISEAYRGDRGEWWVSASGTVLEDRGKKQLTVSFSNASWGASDFDGRDQGLSMNLRFGLSAAPDAVIGFDRGSATELTRLSPLQLMRIYAGFSADPIIGGFMPNLFSP